VTNAESELFKIIVVAGFYPHKGHTKVIELAKALIKRGVTNFTITLKGNPFYTTILEFIKNEIIKHQLEQFIFIEGFNKEHSIEKMYANHDCFLLLSEYEGFGLPVLEAQMSGIPVVCSEIDVFKEVLADSAVFVNTNEIETSCDRVVELMKDDKLRNSLVEKGYENCKRFSWSKMAKETMMVYNRC
jgi:glycosyltransferase involved in cell wall biosynthesis